MTDTPAATTGQTWRLWRNLTARLRPAPIATQEALRTFLQERAALIAQKCAIDYCRGKTGLASYALFTEEPFIKALDICRWESFATVLGDLLLVAEGILRPQLETEQARIRGSLVRMYSSILSGMPAPAHRETGWGDAMATFGERLESASRAGPLQALDVADHSAKRLFETLPIHARMRALDQEVVYGAVRFRMIAVSQEIHRRLVVPDLVGELLADRARPEGSGD
jgi:hypothetical protein